VRWRLNDGRARRGMRFGTGHGVGIECIRMLTPAFLCIDVEHDEHYPQEGDEPWVGFEAIAALIDELRDPLAACSGAEFHPTWFFRMDPLVERCFGRRDFAVHRHRELVDRLQSQGDALGIHVHAHQWDELHGIYSDYTGAWASECVNASADTFEACFEEPPRRCRFGGYFLPEEAVDTAVARGVEVDLTAEPGLGPKTDDPSFGHYTTAPSTDFRDYPRFPYRPSLASVAVPADDPADARPLVEIPLSTYDYEAGLTATAPSSSGALPLNPWKEWPDAHTFWDLVERSMNEAPVSYVAIAARTDAPESEPAARLRLLLEHLPHHPIADRLEFTDPLRYARRFGPGEQPT
jgi:hypothetical protein